ncbi:hypothetical protein M407DRAFT_28929 [Tulasnella calospora MUT 4182]|uniref:Uncharacterized protein n=1 Tax=Tulasnella calospora MUT 4182 TaxID=1051891 RepID=A0A0C3QB34_9AGAM|nr:hypothetical protein M407DRAFT_28929 [Tulasnella calospora MUT 4182]
MEPLASDLLQNETNSVLSSQPAPAPAPGINDALPPELLLSVFDYIYIEMTQPLSYPHTMSEAVERSKRHALLDAMLVCRAWHDLVAGSPRYRTTIDVGIRESLGIWPIGAETLGYGEAQRTFLKQQLAGSGELPIQVNVSLAHVDDRTATFDLLRNQAHRWQVFNLLTKHDKGISEPISQSQLEGLFNLPLPCLTSLHVDRCWVKADTGGPIAVSLQVEAPRLRALSCEFHLAIPRSTSHLRFLSIKDVPLEKLQPSVDGLKVELDQLVELRITACNSGAILSAFSTPTLRKLIVSSNTSNFSAPQSLPQYQHLKELQWDDLGPEPTFSMFLPLCPNLTFFADYVVGLEEDVPLDLIDQPPTVLLEIPNIRLLRGKEEDLWPGMTEILLDSATCTEIAELVDAVPSIQRIRVLRDPTTRGDLENRPNEVRLLGKLRERVNVALWLEPWSDSKGSTD